MAPAVADTPNMCLNLKCMANILPKASDPEGQRKYLSVKTRTSSPVSVAPKKRTLSPWRVPPQPSDCVFPVALSKVPGSARPQCQSTPTSPPSPPPRCLPPSPDLNQSQVSVGDEESEKGRDRERHHRYRGRSYSSSTCVTSRSLRLTMWTLTFLPITGVCVSL